MDDSDSTDPQYWDAGSFQLRNGIRIYKPNTGAAAWERVRLLSSDPRPQFVLHDIDIAKSGSRDTLPLVKAALFSAHSILVTEACEFWTPQGQHPDTAKTTWHGNVIASQAVSDVEDKLHDPLYSGVFTVIPESYKRGEEDWVTAPGSPSNGSPDMVEYILDEAKLADHYSNEGALLVSFQNPFVAQQLLEKKAEPSVLINLWLPALAGLSLDTILRLRVDEQESFDRLHRAIQTLLIDLSTEDSDAKIIEILQRTHREVREYQDKLQLLKARGGASLAGSAIASAVMGGSLVVPSQLAELLIAIVGAVSLREIAGMVLNGRYEKRQLRRSDFYAAVRAGSAAEYERRASD